MGVWQKKEDHCGVGPANVQVEEVVGMPGGTYSAFIRCDTCHTNLSTTVEGSNPTMAQGAGANYAHEHCPLNAQYEW